jgi:hypothetical protein
LLNVLILPVVSQTHFGGELLKSDVRWVALNAMACPRSQAMAHPSTIPPTDHSGEYQMFPRLLGTGCALIF